MDPYVGEIRLFAGTYAPRDWEFCNGQTLQIQENSVLFSVIGNQFGGDGETTFQLPDLRGRAPMHSGQGIGLTPRAFGKPDGEAQVTLLEAEIPSHSHTPQTQLKGSELSPEGAVWTPTSKIGKNAAPKYYSNTPSVSMNPLAIGTTGESQPHNNMQPYTELNFIIALQGVFPEKTS
ncbi:microcystin dependent MdpB family protein [Paenibacillus sp. J45TS6]|uniref:phage tail protein n=1 Tax=unclassified Paenibacillus TaxID=185978 RepID=UPI001B27E26F|nr:tail fiber protein [Paenibacillus sp. J45TS6]GIP43294.1 microcystin dependent MdpB family protein [Paenibacillus sp. J45TS6]